VGLVALGFGVALGIAGYRAIPPAISPAWPVFLSAFVLAAAASFAAGRSRVKAQWQMQIQMQEQKQDQEQKQAQSQELHLHLGGALPEGLPAERVAPAAALVVTSSHDHDSSGVGSGEQIALTSTHLETAQALITELTGGSASDPATALALRPRKTRSAVFPPDP
jgi:hypothetical protein